MHRESMVTKEQIRAKSDATHLKNLLAKAATQKLSKWDESILKRLKAEATAQKDPGQ
jgi:hypothetical protein